MEPGNVLSININETDSYLLRAETYHSEYPIHGEVCADVGAGCHVHDGSYGAQVKDRTQSVQQGGLVRLRAVHQEGTANR